ncbi:MAG: hypothetical protein OXI87_21385 [Albidovulum sp.]|nr:hypothetical protein [Albidovulum sp.]
MGTGIWEFTKSTRKMPLTTSIFNNVLQSSGFSKEERLIREAVQNSVDAHRVNAELPVSVRIEKRTIRGQEKQRLVDALRLDCEPKHRLHKFDLPENNALTFISDSDEPMQVLMIEDFNTCGLGGVWDGTDNGDDFGRLVVNLGIDDKAEGTEISGGSFGFGKTVYGKTSQIGTVGFYSVFDKSPVISGAHARFMATGLYKSHELDGERFSGFAFFGESACNDEPEAIPFLDDEAHEIARLCGLEPRSEEEHGTSILIIDVDIDMAKLKHAAELYWWPRLEQKQLDLVLVDEEVELWPRPRKNPQVEPFVRAWLNLVSDSSKPPKSQVERFRRQATKNNGYLHRATISCLVLETETSLANHVALVRGPGMVVNYISVGSESYEPAVGVVRADPDIEKILTYSEPQMHDIWDPNSDRLQQHFPVDGPKVVSSTLNSTRNYFARFQKLQEPPVPTGGLEPRTLSRLLGRVMRTGSAKPLRPPEKRERPVTIGVREDRVYRDGAHFDEAEITLRAKSVPESFGPVRCCLIVAHETLGDPRFRVIERGECELLDENGTSVAKGDFARLMLELDHANNRKVLARAKTDEFTMSQFRVAVEARP